MSCSSSRRDVPPERLYKVLWVAQKGVGNITRIWYEASQTAFVPQA
ncbi:hypothetical protein H6F98_26445 [Microcoleus sp. FACHB-SPT15]|nr:hypothetical protein [Microcoleus sp. FACHB-SPT15]MBD1808968.1 hypothetical protein [Microcoleus sp. FACHB-SPT15]